MNAPASGPTPSPDSHRDPVLFAADGSRAAGNDGTDRNWLPWTIAVVAIVVALGLAFFFANRHSAQSAALGPRIDPYAANLVLSNVQMSQASNFAGGQLTYIDGILSNHGDRTVTSVDVKVVFANDAGEPPQVEEVPLALIRTRNPYVDTEAVSAAPLAPGKSQDFRLIFDDVSPLWNQQIPRLTVLSVKTRR